MSLSRNLNPPICLGLVTPAIKNYGRSIRYLSEERMRRFLIIGLYLCIAAVYAQILAPVAAMSMERTVDPFAAICTHAPSESRDQPSDSGHHDHQHCLLCHAFVALPTLDGRPAFTALDYPVASPLRWTVVDVGTRVTSPNEAARPRGPPNFI